MEKKNGVNVEEVTFDVNGEIAGLDDETLASINAGVAEAKIGPGDEQSLQLDTNNCTINNNCG